MPQQLHLIDDTALKRDYLGQSPAALGGRRGVPSPDAVALAAVNAGPRTVRRGQSGQATRPFAAAPPAISDAVAAAVLSAFLAGVCRACRIDYATAIDLLAQRWRPSLTKDALWRRCAYARQLAMYLAVTEADISQAQIARVAGLTDAAVNKAMRAAEDLRDDNAAFEQLIGRINRDVSMVDQARRRDGIGRGRRRKKDQR